MTTPKMPDAQVIPTDEIKPYFRNPRQISEEAIEAVAESIERYGYQQPIVVDGDNVIVVGHTRYAAMQKLGYEEIPVYVTDLPEDKVREYRLVDNRTSEMTTWDHVALLNELREFEESVLGTFFPDLDLELKTIEDALITEDDVAEATRRVGEVNEPKPMHTTDIVCPACFHTFKVMTDSLPATAIED